MNSSHLLIALSFLILPLQVCCQSFSKVLYDSPGDWVSHNEADFEAQPGDTETEGTYYLLIDKQSNIVKSERYFRAAYRIMTIDGLQQNADLTVDFDPTYEQLVFHEAKIIRNGEHLNKLNPVSVKVVQREQQMDRYLYDGKLTAIIHLSDLRIGDIVEYSYSKKGFNPVYDGHYSEELYFQYSLPYERGHFRIIKPADKDFRLVYRNGEDPPLTSRTGNEISYAWSFNKMAAVRYENNTPGWHDPYYKVMITDFSSWDDLKPWTLKHYQLKNQHINSLKSIVGDYFKGENHQETALNIIRFVQDEVRYLGFEDGMHSHKPHEPLQVFEQRFGDCKDKSMLLCALLACYDIEANPVIVNSSLRKHVAAHIPAINSFDHVVTQIITERDTIYVDPTISNQGGTFKNIYFPGYGKGFVVNPVYGGMTDISQDRVSKIEELKDYNLEPVGNGSGLLIQTTYYGAEADWMRRQLAGTSLDMIQQNYLDFYANIYPDIETEFPVKIVDNREDNILETTEYYHIPQLWHSENKSLTAEFFAAGLEQYVRVAKSNTRRNSPYQLNYPTTYQHRTKIRLPEPWQIDDNSVFILQPEYKYSYNPSYVHQEILLDHEYQTLKNDVPVHNIETFIADHDRIRNNLVFLLQYNGGYIDQGAAMATPPIILTIITLLAGIWLIIKVYRYDPLPDPDFEHQEAPKPIGGWLILFTIGIVLSPVVIIYFIFIDDSFYNPAYWHGYFESGNITYSLFISIQLVYNLILLLFSIVLAVLFVMQRSSVPKLVLIRLLGNLFITMVIMAFGSALVENVEYNEKDLIELSRMFIGAAIWVPYFLVSKRVKATFLNRLRPAEGHATTINPDTIDETGKV